MSGSGLSRIGTEMKKLLVLMLLLCALPASALEVAGVNVADKAKVGPGELVLNGAGIRTRMVFKVYVGALYLAEKTSAAAGAMTQKGAKRVALTLLRDLSAQQLNEALEMGIQANSEPAEIEVLKPRIAELLSLFTDGKKGDVIVLDFLPESGTSVGLNGQTRGKPIPGEDFYRALLRIWLGEKPVDGDLKKGMLGQAL
jgi:chalcone isomerase-like protein